MGRITVRRLLASHWLASSTLLFLASRCHYRGVTDECWHRGECVSSAASTAVQHIFVYESFFYRNSTSFDTRNEDTLVTLLIADRHNHLGRVSCAHDGHRGYFGGSGELVAGQLHQIISADHCRLKLYVAICSFPAVPAGDGAGRFQVQLVSEVAETPPITIHPSKPETTRARRFVVCMSRVYAFENWRLLITALEIYRSLGVDQVFTHVKSALSSVYTLMRIYEREGFLVARPGLELPFVELFDPNSETEHTNQLKLAHECFYTYRERTEFIALLDWDDLLVSRDGSRTLYETFTKATMLYPSSAYFSVNKVQTTFRSRGAFPTLDVEKQLSGIKSSTVFNEHKIVVRPSKLYGFWAHDAHNMLSGYKGTWLTTKHALLLHLSKRPSDEYRHNFTSGLNTGLIKRRVDGLFASNKEAMERLPIHRHYEHIVAKCASLQRYYYKVEDNIRCLSYPLCPLPSLNVACTRTVNTFASSRVHSRLFVHVRRQKYFVERIGC